MLNSAQLSIFAFCHRIQHSRLVLHQRISLKYSRIFFFIMLYHFLFLTILAFLALGAPVIHGQDPSSLTWVHVPNANTFSILKRWASTVRKNPVVISGEQ